MLNPAAVAALVLLSLHYQLPQASRQPPPRGQAGGNSKQRRSRRGAGGAAAEGESEEGDDEDVEGEEGAGGDGDAAAAAQEEQGQQQDGDGGDEEDDGRPSRGPGGAAGSFVAFMPAHLTAVSEAVVVLLLRVCVCVLHTCNTTQHIPNIIIIRTSTPS